MSIPLHRHDKASFRLDRETEVDLTVKKPVLALKAGVEPGSDPCASHQFESEQRQKRIGKVAVIFRMALREIVPSRMIEWKLEVAGTASRACQATVRAIVLT